MHAELISEIGDLLTDVRRTVVLSGDTQLHRKPLYDQIIATNTLATELYYVLLCSFVLQKKNLIKVVDFYITGLKKMLSHNIKSQLHSDLIDGAF